MFQPGFTFSLATTGWENLADGGGDFALLSVTTPGDAIYFFRHPRATKPDGTLDSSGGNTARSLTDWLGANDAVSVTPAKAVSVGSLRGWTTDLTVSPGTVAHLSDCPAQVCVGLFRGKDPSSKPTWQWDWGSAGPERQRLYLLQASNDVVLIVVDSLDGDTFDSLSQAARAIVESVTFDKP